MSSWPLADFLHFAHYFVSPKLTLAGHQYFLEKYYVCAIASGWWSKGQDGGGGGDLYFRVLSTWVSCVLIHRSFVNSLLKSC